VTPIANRGMLLARHERRDLAPDALPGALDQLVDWVDTGKLIRLETERHGLESLASVIHRDRNDLYRVGVLIREKCL
jgi:hypothetical protein